MLTELIHQKNCKKNEMITDAYTGEIACGSCGIVSSDQIVDQGSESVGSNPNDYMNNSRVGAKRSLKMIDMGLSTIIEAKDRDVTGKPLSLENRRMFYRLRMWDRNSRSAASSKSFQKAFILLDAISSKLGLPESVVEETAYLFRKIAARKILAGRSTSAMLCATIYITCRITDTPRTLQDVVEAGNIKKKVLQRTYRFLAKELDLSPEAYSPSEFVARISKGLTLSQKTQRLAFKILDLCAKKQVSTSKNPMAMAAAAVYLASTITVERVSQLKISKISGISAVTIRERKKEIVMKIGDVKIG
ncbi:MAG: transcription factor TFIIB [Nitrosopumilus sp. BACL13 MAG-121220-bin23]|jgi:transcription initiation factor TFIIB|nr:MAG: transcription factor TFIIB [Nitrosopumilus sp. BACL13 MAG-121220-bin23]KRO30364.1 MAG: transcription factor TFIIB [Nitrosopumilus sp. BACL13 MAG-120910-bin56]